MDGEEAVVVVAQVAFCLAPDHVSVVGEHVVSIDGVVACEEEVGYFAEVLYCHVVVEDEFFDRGILERSVR